MKLIKIVNSYNYKRITNDIKAQEVILLFGNKNLIV